MQSIFNNKQYFTLPIYIPYYNLVFLRALLNKLFVLIWFNLYLTNLSIINGLLIKKFTCETINDTNQPVRVFSEMKLKNSKKWRKTTWTTKETKSYYFTRNILNVHLNNQYFVYTLKDSSFHKEKWEEVNKYIHYAKCY